jgi:hypothetical protein
LAAALEQQLHAARWSIGVIGLIMDGTGPARVPDHIIDALRKREDKGVIELPGVVKHEQPECSDFFKTCYEQIGDEPAGGTPAAPSAARILVLRPRCAVVRARERT